MFLHVLKIRNFLEKALESGVDCGFYSGESQGWLNEDLNCPRTREPEFPGILIPEGQLNEARRLVGQHRFRLLDHVRIHAPTNGHRTEDVPALADPHVRPLLAWGRAHGMYQGRESDTPIAVTQLFELLEECAHTIYTNGVASRSSAS